MSLIRTISLGLVATAAVAANADTTSSVAPTLEPLAKVKPGADLNPVSFLIPKIGVRVGGGNWKEFMVDAGVDVTFNVPFIPIPAIRVDGEVWGKPGSFGQDRRGNALSLLGIQTFIAGYAGLGLTYYYTDDQGDHHSGLGVKALGGLSLPHGMYAEAGIILGPKMPPVFFTLGQRF